MPSGEQFHQLKDHLSSHTFCNSVSGFLAAALQAPLPSVVVATSGEKKILSNVTELQNFLKDGLVQINKSNVVVC